MARTTVAPKRAPRKLTSRRPALAPSSPIKNFPILNALADPIGNLWSKLAGGAGAAKHAQVTTSSDSDNDSMEDDESDSPYSSSGSSSTTSFVAANTSPATTPPNSSFGPSDDCGTFSNAPGAYPSSFITTQTSSPPRSPSKKSKSCPQECVRKTHPNRFGLHETESLLFTLPSLPSPAVRFAQEEAIAQAEFNTLSNAKMLSQALRSERAAVERAAKYAALPSTKHAKELEQEHARANFDEEKMQQEHYRLKVLHVANEREWLARQGEKNRRRLLGLPSSSAGLARTLWGSEERRRAAAAAAAQKKRQAEDYFRRRKAYDSVRRKVALKQPLNSKLSARIAHAPCPTPPFATHHRLPEQQARKSTPFHAQHTPAAQAPTAANPFARPNAGPDRASSPFKSPNKKATPKKNHTSAPPTSEDDAEHMRSRKRAADREQRYFELGDIASFIRRRKWEAGERVGDASPPRPRRQGMNNTGENTNPFMQPPPSGNFKRFGGHQSPQRPRVNIRSGERVFGGCGIANDFGRGGFGFGQERTKPTGYKVPPSPFPTPLFSRPAGDDAATNASPEEGRIKTRLSAYDARWASLLAIHVDDGDCVMKTEFSFESFPWPLLTKPKSLADITPEAVEAFLMHPLRSASPSGAVPVGNATTTRRQLAKDALLRWHPDKFPLGRVQECLVADEDAETVKEGAAIVGRILVGFVQG